MTAEDIVRQLAVQDPVGGSGNRDLCAYYCGAVGRSWRWDAPDGDDLNDPDTHQPDCVWRAAREWVAANDAEMRS